MKAITAIFALSLAAPALAQTPAAPANVAPLPPIVSKMPEGMATQKLTVTSKALAGGTVPMDNTSYGASTSIDLAWSAGPAATLSYVLIAEDSDVARDGSPINHWVAYNIPAKVRALPSGLPKTTDVPAVPGMTQIPTAGTNGVTGYRGPRTPAGQTHTYHFQVFALDSKITPVAGPGRAGVVAAMNGHVLANGEVVATFTGPAAPPATQN